MTAKMVKRFTAEPVAEVGATLGEGPRWDPRAGRLVWVDITGRAVHLFDPERGADAAYPVPWMVGAALPRASGGYALAVEGGVVAWTPGAEPEPLVRLEAGADRRANDAACDPQGRLLMDTVPLHDAAAPAGRLYRIDPSHEATVLLDGLGLPNGLDWSPDGRTLYFTDSGTGRVDAYPYDPDAGTLGRPRPAVAPEAGIPDGHTVDAEGNLWVALWSAGEVGCFGPDGRRLATVTVPVPTVTSCGFGRADLSTLFVTTMAHPEPGQPNAAAGTLFACAVGVPGRAPAAYAG
ncbi:MAG TPA: SMP-30/gluconolactonase/LRE family protein [Acidimicrobiales bacterium]